MVQPSAFDWGKEEKLILQESVWLHYIVGLSETWQIEDNLLTVGSIWDFNCTITDKDCCLYLIVLSEFLTRFYNLLEHTGQIFKL